ncbi:MAG: non-canonical purine NTP diphosphatase [Bacteroidales bacterium]|jgi:XTP/dITP diphosphohydrolase|nr:non-canonical purine NTP diphosphatase [Bacteroidales bacterium]
MDREIIFATNNKNKLIEAREIASKEYSILSLSDIGFIGDIPEDYETLEENALQKSRIISQKYNINCFADDTGLEVDALNGAPGVYSARYAGEGKNPTDNVLKLLRELENENNRSARFRTVIALIFDNKEYLFEGIINGKITENIKGKNGFGYDPVFIPEDYSETFAELNSSEKNKISHRAIAIQRMFDFLKTLYK